MELALGETDAAVEMGFFVAGEGRRLVRAHDHVGDAESHGHGDTAPRRRRRPDRLVQHAAAELRLEGVSRGVLRQRGSAEAVGAHARVGSVVRRAVQRAASAGCAQRRPRSRREAGPPLVEHRDVDLVSFTGSAETGRWIARTPAAQAGEGRARARRQECARRLRRRRPRPCRRVVARVGVLERRPALRCGEPDRRVRLRLRRVPRAARRGRAQRTRQGP